MDLYILFRVARIESRYIVIQRKNFAQDMIMAGTTLLVHVHNSQSVIPTKNVLVQENLRLRQE